MNDTDYGKVELYVWEDWMGDVQCTDVKPDDYDEGHYEYEILYVDRDEYEDYLKAADLTLRFKRAIAREYYLKGDV